MIETLAGADWGRKHLGLDIIRGVSDPNIRRWWRRVVVWLSVLSLVATPATLSQENPATIAQEQVALSAPVAESPFAPPTPTGRFRPAAVRIDDGVWVGYAVLDRATGQLWGSPTMHETTWPASMLKAWLAADYLARTPHLTEGDGELLDTMIRDSDNAAAQTLYRRLGGDETFRRMIATCGLTDTTPGGGWSFVSVSAADAARVADCIADGRAAGPQWTPWLLDAMRTVRIGDWGIRDVLPEPGRSRVAIKNGWNHYVRDGLWRVNCMAVSKTWAMAVLVRFRPRSSWEEDFAYGIGVCQSVAGALLNPAYGR